MPSGDRAITRQARSRRAQEVSRRRRNEHGDRTMTTTDEQLIQQLRRELDELVAGVGDVAGDPPLSQPNSAGDGADRDRRWVAVGIAAATVAALVGGLVVVANRDAGEATSDTPPATATPNTATATTAAATVPATTVPPVDSVAPTTQPVVPDPAVQRYEVIAP